jgi:hypothetical protein
LFTKNLQKIQIFDEISSNSIIIEVKHENERSLLKLSKNEEEFSFQYKMIKMKKVTFMEKEIELNFGFHINMENQADPKFHFIYSTTIPIRSYGFPFLIHSNFKLTFNKEDINHDDEFNKFINEYIVDGFIQCIDFFKNENSLKYDWYNYIPIENDLFNEFKDISKKIIERLK